MKLSNLIEEDLMGFDLQSSGKDDVIRELVDLASKSKLVRDKDLLLDEVQKREKLVTTGVGWGVAFPHAKTKAMKGIVIAFGRSEKGVEFGAMDQKPVHLFFLIAAPEDTIGAHLNVMARLSFLMKSQDNRERLLSAKNPGEVLEVLDSVD
jgi:fructose-specific phosphotransferase system IIA component